MPVAPEGIILPDVLWQMCVDQLREELPAQQFNTWIRPLQSNIDASQLTLLAPNRFIRDFVSDKYRQRIGELVRRFEPNTPLTVCMEIGVNKAVAEPKYTPV